MVNINIEIPEELHRKIKLDSVLQNITRKELIIRLLKAHMKSRRKN